MPTASFSWVSSSCATDLIVVSSELISAGSNTGGVIFPLIIPLLISRYGIETTIRIYAVALVVCLVPVLPFMKARLPESRVHGPARRSASIPQWLRNRDFWFFVSINTLQGFGHFVPLIWLPSTWNSETTYLWHLKLTTTIHRFQALLQPLAYRLHNHRSLSLSSVPALLSLGSRWDTCQTDLIYGFSP